MLGRNIGNTNKKNVDANYSSDKNDKESWSVINTIVMMTSVTKQFGSDHKNIGQD